MKGIHISKRILFIIVLCLLWLPNYCDIKQNEADSQGFQADESVSSDPSSIRNVPPKQEKEIFGENLELPIKKMAVQPNVEYVNNIENKEFKVTREGVRDMHSSEKDQLPEENQQQIQVELESSRLSNAEVKSEPSVKHNEIPRNSEKQEAKFSDSPSLKHSGPAKLVLTSPSIEPSLTRQSLEKTIKLMETMPKPVTSNSIELDITANARKEPSKMPHHIPTAVELNKQILEEGMHQQPHYDGMPSFDEWKKMMLAEQEKGGQKVPSPTPPGKKISSQKRRRNYSSYECGAKIVASNPEAEGTSRILNELVDEYMLNPCKAKIWFVLELCESVQATQIELANFELFSSCPKEFAVYSSDNFPTRDWVLLGTFTAAEQRVLQSFELKQEGFGKFIKIELLSYYGKEHYCPLSVVRIFGTSMVDEYEEMEMEKSASHPVIPDDDLDRLDIVMEDKKSTNIFGSATDAVINIVKKAAQALGQHNPPDDTKINDTNSDPQNMSESKLCKVSDNSSNKCEDVSVAKSDNLQTVHNFSILPSSMHQSLFRLLHRCDQCVSSRLRYYSSAQPHCRFFQAAFGPIVLQRLCDWFREHPLVFAHESASHSNKVPPNSDNLVPLPTKSPPPQIMVVPLDNDTSIKKLLLQGSLSFDRSNKSAFINATKASYDVGDSAEVHDKVHLEASIKATRTQQFIHTIALNDSDKKLPFVDSSDAIPPIAHTISEIHSKPTATIPDDETQASEEKIVIETGSIEISSTESSTATEVFTEVDEEQIKEFLSDSISATEDISLSESIVTSTESPLNVKQTEEKVPDMRSDTQGKLEPVSVSGVSTAGQKESVFMRMSNRIKSLELNMSLSSQYLQELSQRYRRQMEEMQRAFNRTIGTLNDTARKAAEKDIRQQEILNSLQLQVGNLTETVEVLLSERSSVFRQMVETHVCLMVIEAIIMITVMSLYVRRISSCIHPTPRPGKEQVTVSARLSKRRSSVDSCTPPVARKMKKRSASEEGLNAGEEPLVIEPLPVLLDPILKVKKKNRKRNKVQRSASHPSVQRRNSSPSQCAAKPVSHSEGCMLPNVRSKHQIHGKNHACENCNNNTCTEITVSEKGRRLNGAPFQNLTNGTLPNAQEQLAKSQRIIKGRDKFSLRKFLKFQKRDSI